MEFGKLMSRLQRTPDGLKIDLRAKNYRNVSYSGVSRQDHKFLLCYSTEGRALLLNTRNNSGALAIEIDKFHDRFNHQKRS